MWIIWLTLGRGLALFTQPIYSIHIPHTLERIDELRRKNILKESFNMIKLSHFYLFNLSKFGRKVSRES